MTVSLDPIEANPALRRGWTTGACATAAARACVSALTTGTFPDPVEILLPNGARPAFTLASHRLDGDQAYASVVKDAGDDPDVTHGALIEVSVRPAPGEGLRFHAGPGVGTVTRAGLPLPIGEPAINPAPREMIRENLAEVLGSLPLDYAVTIGVENGAKIAERTLNGRLGILGGLSILGTTGIVVPFSCAAWINSIHRGIDVARAAGLTHLAGATGNTSELAVQKLHDLPDHALIDMGDFVGGMLKYLNAHPVPRITIAGGFAKMTKLAQGRLDLHSRRGEIDFERLSAWVVEAGGSVALAEKARNANSALEVLQLAEGLPLPEFVARTALLTAQSIVKADMKVDVSIFNRDGLHLASSS